jgi:NitT/TauT family transport system substrate-binding protein
MKHRIAVIGLALAVLLSPIVAFNTNAKDINLGWSGQGSWSTLPYIVAGERGLFEKEGLKVRLITFRGTNLMLTALLAGELDYATILPFLTGASARGLPVKILGAVTRSSSYVIISRPEIDSIKALRGKKIGINSFGSSADYAAYAAVSRSGLDPNKDVTILPIGGGSPERFAALVSGSVDATVVTSLPNMRQRSRG